MIGILKKPFDVRTELEIKYIQSGTRALQFFDELN